MAGDARRSRRRRRLNVAAAAVFLDRDGVLNRATVGRRRAARAAAGRPSCEILPEARGALPAPCARRVRLDRASPTSRRSRAATLDPGRGRARCNGALAAELDSTSPRLPARRRRRLRLPQAEARDVARGGRTRHGIDLASSFTVGDRWRDVEAGRAGGYDGWCSSTAGYDERADQRRRTAVVSDARGGSRGSSTQTRTLMSQGPSASELRVKIFADGADLEAIAELCREPADPGLHHQPDPDAQGGGHRLRGVRPRARWSSIGDRPISFEVFTDDFAEMAPRGADPRRPGATTSTSRSRSPTPRATSSAELVQRAELRAGSSSTSPALFTLQQVRDDLRRPRRRRPGCISLFAGRIADAGVDPVPMVARGGRDDRRAPAAGADLGEPARGPQHRPGRRRRAATSSPSPTTCWRSCRCSART